MVSMICGFSFHKNVNLKNSIYVYLFLIDFFLQLNFDYFGFVCVFDILQGLWKTSVSG